MKCNLNRKESVSRNKVTEFYLTALSYVLFEHGFEGEKILDVLRDVEDTADSMCKDYIEFGDIKKVLKDEYNFELRFNR